MVSACRELTVGTSEQVMMEDRVKREKGMGLGWHKLAAPRCCLEKGAGLPEGSLEDSEGLEIGKSSVWFFFSP